MSRSQATRGWKKVGGALLIAAWLLPAAARLHGAESSSSWADQPYRLVVDLHYSDNPLLTKQFKESLRREVIDRLRNEFRRLALLSVETGETVDENYVREERPFPADIAAGEKRFVFFVDFTDDVYSLAWRQFDGDLKLRGRLRTKRTPDRQWVGKAVCLAVQGDFEPIAVVTPGTDAVELTFRGEAWPDELRQHLQPPCILRVLAIKRNRDGSLVSKVIPHTVLVPTETRGRWTARCESDKPNPLVRTPELVEFRAIKLCTQAGIVEVRVLDYQTKDPVRQCAVYVGTTGFDEKLDEMQRLAPPDHDGCTSTQKLINHLAYVQIEPKGSARVKVPFEVTDDLSVLTYRVHVDGQGSEKIAFEREVRFLDHDIKALTLALDDRAREVNPLIEEKRYEQAEAMAQATLDFAQPFHQNHIQALSKIKRRAAEINRDDIKALASLDQRSKENGDAIQRQIEIRDQLRNVIQENNTKAHSQLIKSGGDDLVRKGEIEQALQAYADSLREFPDQPKLRELLARYKATWAIKSPEHQAARDFFFNEWPKTELDQLEATMDEARHSLQVLRDVNDDLTAYKLRAVAQEFLSQLQELADALEGETDAAAEESARATVKLYTELDELVKATFELSDKKPSGGKSTDESPASTDDGP